MDCLAVEGWNCHLPTPAQGSSIHTCGNNKLVPELPVGTKAFIHGSASQNFPGTAMYSKKTEKQTASR